MSNNICVYVFAVRTQASRWPTSRSGWLHSWACTHASTWYDDFSDYLVILSVTVQRYWS